MGVKVKVNKSKVSLSAYLEQEVNEKGTRMLRNIAEDLVDLSPVWSGAYVTSHSFVPKGSGAGRRRESYRDKGPVDKGSKKQEALGLLYQDIDRVNLFKSGGGVFRNRAPHAFGVERGDAPAKRGYWVYDRVAKRWGSG